MNPPTAPQCECLWHHFWLCSRKWCHGIDRSHFTSHILEWWQGTMVIGRRLPYGHSEIMFALRPTLILSWSICTRKGIFVPQFFCLPAIWYIICPQIDLQEINSHFLLRFLEEFFFTLQITLLPKSLEWNTLSREKCMSYWDFGEYSFFFGSA